MYINRQIIQPSSLINQTVQHSNFKMKVKYSEHTMYMYLHVFKHPSCLVALHIVAEGVGGNEHAASS